MHFYSQMNSEPDKGQLIMALLERMKDVPPLPEEESFLTNTET